jgi:hypothetical protein
MVLYNAGFCVVKQESLTCGAAVTPLVGSMPSASKRCRNHNTQSTDFHEDTENLAVSSMKFRVLYGAFFNARIHARCLHM